MIAIGALISILTFVAAIAFWLDRAVVQEAAFLDLATEVLEMDTSQQALAERLMDEAIDAVPLLALVRGAGERAIVVILDSGAFDPAIDNLVVAGHRHVMSAAEGPFVSDLSDVRDVLVEPIARISPNLAERIPVDVFGEVVILDEEALPAIVRTAGWVPAVSVVAAAVAVFLAVAVVMLAGRRSLAAVIVGLAVLIAGGGVVLWSVAGGSLFPSRIDDPISRVLVENGYAVFSRSLTAVGAWLIVLGFVVTAAGLIGVLIGAARGTEAPETS
ncbi:MAG: hypothetical protein WCC01_09175 [Acidimicrobiia bacterium]